MVVNLVAFFAFLYEIRVERERHNVNLAMQVPLADGHETTNWIGALFKLPKNLLFWSKKQASKVRLIKSKVKLTNLNNSKQFNLST